MHSLELNLAKTAWKHSFGNRMLPHHRERVPKYMNIIGCPLDIRKKLKRDNSSQMKRCTASAFDDFVCGNCHRSKSSSPGLAENIWAVAGRGFDAMSCCPLLSAMPPPPHPPPLLLPPFLHSLHQLSEPAHPNPHLHQLEQLPRAANALCLVSASVQGVRKSWTRLERERAVETQTLPNAPLCFSFPFRLLILNTIPTFLSLFGYYPKLLLEYPLFLSL
eukprot:2322665-Pleurochrysis_carterae.AAC.1